MDSPIMPISPSRYNPKVIERKMRAETDWAKLVRHQQALAEKMIQQEKDMRMLQRMELKDTLNTLVNEKQTNKMREDQQARQEAYFETKEREKDFNDYRMKLKSDKTEFQKLISDEYVREKWLRDEEIRRKMEEEKRLDEQMINNALTSLEREKIMKERQRNDFINDVERLMNERELQKKKEQEQAEQNRQEHIQLTKQAIYNVDMKDLNYKLYYQKLMEKQNNRQQIHNQKVTQAVLSKEMQIDQFIDQGVEEGRRRAEEEERRRRMQREEQLRNMTDNNVQKIRENQNEQIREKLSYQDKVQELMRQNKEVYDFNNQMKMYKAYQMTDYKNTLQYQMKEHEEVKRKFDSDMSEHEKKMHLNAFGARLIPGIKNTTNDLLNFPTIKSKTIERMKTESLSSPFGPSQQLAGQSFFGAPSDYDTTSPIRKSTNNMSFHSPSSPNIIGKNEQYNPITNPIPHFNQNPYLKDSQKDSPQRNKLRNILAATADANLVQPGH